ncbi:MAG: DNA helicase II, partial [Alphaproteobacteria bacterium]|nr:DNA helicase II [Alphaproteobacteria bacterium]
ERRLAYVGITRARKTVQLSFAGSRRIHGQWQSSIPSRFVQELPPETVIEDIAQGLGGAIPFGRAAQVQMSGDSSFGGSGETRGGYGPGWRRMAERRAGGIDDGFRASNNKTEFAPGERVFHQKFGMGNITHIDGDKLEIAFDKAGSKKVVAGFVSKP